MSRLEHLEDLGRRLTDLGVGARVVSGEVPVLRVENPGPPTLDEVVGCQVGPQGALWFSWVGSGVLLAPVGEADVARERVALVLAMAGGAES
ncbi:hypothetical protein [Actinocorallia sp. A-T 12471]|uniref:hypothetical protein n=1 Tax=Actinocorallia sp. A-T 12471 TaxID=3089813 RepID=UPI0029D1E435|nr:hypothetical protein [Actinocorallia sp. A-T 12471]MDX6741441.1 hypothetical protein [Actinocorallia sp. A-T 12471]